MGEEVWGSPFLAAHAAFRRNLGRAATAESREEGDIYAVRTGVHSDAQNGAVGTGVVDVEDRDRVVLEMISWLREWDAPASWLCADPAGSLTEALVAAGCRPELSASEMYASIAELDLEWKPVTGVNVSRVRTVGQLECWTSIAAECGWFHDDADAALEQTLYGQLALDTDSALRLYVARENEQLLGMAVAFLAGSILLLDSVAVRPSDRRRGIGRSLALARLRDAHDQGCTIAVLAPTPDGRQLYESLGFHRRPQPPNRWFYLP